MAKAYNLRHKEEISLRNKEYYSKNSEKLKQRSQEWIAKNHEKFLKRKRNYNVAHAVERNEKQKAYWFRWIA